MEELTFEQQTKILVSKLNNLIKEIQSIRELAKNVGNSDEQFNTFRGRYKELENYKNKFFCYWDELYALYVQANQEANFPMDEKYSRAVRSYIYECNSVFESFMSPIPKPQHTPLQTDHVACQNETLNVSNATAVRSRLPKINIPSFSGDLIDWPQFRDIFKSLVHEESSLTPVEKFHYLIGSLSGEPLRIASSFSIVGDSYDNAWKALTERYDNKRILAKTYIQKVKQFKLPSAASSNPTQLRLFLRTVDDSFTSFSALKIPNEADYFRLQLALDCLGQDLRKLFEEKQQKEKDDFPTYKSLVEFIQGRCQVLELAEESTPRSSHGHRAPTRASSKHVSAFVHRPSSPEDLPHVPRPTELSCPNCKRDHPLFKCNGFKHLTQEQRLCLARSKHLCFNCLREGHSLTDCPSQVHCHHCKGRHHTLLHKPRPSKPAPETPPCCNPNDTEASKPQAGLTASTAGASNVLLGTALVNIQGWNGKWQRVRAVIDTGSQFSIMSSECARNLGLHWRPSKHIVSGVGETQLPQTKGMVVCRIAPDNDLTKSLQIRALVMSKLIPCLPTAEVPVTARHLFRNVRLADADFWQPRPVDILLGSDVFFQILTNEKGIKISDSFGTLPTIFGHLVIGSPPDSTDQINPVCLMLTAEPVSDGLMRSFWEVEDVPSNTELLPTDQRAEDHFRSYVQRLPTGRYVVGLPLINENIDYSDSRSLAMSRFMKLEARLNRDPHLKAQYDAFMQEYIDLGHMKVASEEPKYVIPHHAVFKKEVTSNVQPKLRVVFDASMKTRNGSLNENLLPGPKLQNNLSIILLNFRLNAIVFCTDIVKMFRQILVIPKHRPFQNIYWRFSNSESVQTYQLQTITYGETSSPYLAIRTLNQLVEDEGENFPRAANVLRNQIYVDDIITGADSLEDALEIKSQLIGILGRGCFPVHKWASNNDDFLATVSEDLQEPQVSISPEDESVSKVLGMLWDSRSDTFRYKLNLNPSMKTITKRSMLSVVARLFDPLGLLAPTVLLAKTFIQGLWKLNIGWDDPPPEQIRQPWVEFIQDLPEVSQIIIPRWILPKGSGTLKLFGFCDASEKAYAASVYLVSFDLHSSETHSFLLSAKTRLAPVKTITIPRLELCAAHLLIKLLHSIKNFTDNLEVTETFLLTDSTIVLSWLRMHPQELKTFVANRVSNILHHSKVDQWRHVPSEQNPADISSRGVLASALRNSDLWWRGPQWLRTYPFELPPMPPALRELPEVKPTNHDFCLVTMNGNSPAMSLIAKFSDFTKLIFVTARLLRFKNCLRKLATDPLSPLSLDEIEEAKNVLILEVQSRHFPSDYDYKSKSCTSFRFQSLNVFEDSRGVLRVGGRLSNAMVPYDVKHPIVLPHDSRFTELIIDYHHKRNFHLGAKALQATMQRSYYIFRIKSLIKKRIFNCVKCYKLKSKPNNPLMGDLPLSRVTQGRPFINVGVDFAGPYSIKEGMRRNSPISKAYMCMYVCMAVKAVHIELVSSLSTEAFLAAFSRFVSRRGLPSQVFSDCGTNFIGAARELKELYKWYHDTKTQDSVSRNALELGIQWNFNPPSAPHFGGLWEAAIKSAKILLKKSAGDRPFYFEELTTLFCQIESILNSRPLCPVSENPSSFDYLSPGHFLIGSALTAPPERDLTDVNVNRLNRWQLIQTYTQLFWRRWSNEYFHLLQTRNKWTKKTTPLKEEDLVLIQEPNSDRYHWRLGRITKLFPDSKGVARVAELKTATGELTRPVHRLAPLDPINEKG